MYRIDTSRTSGRVGEGIMNMNKSFGIRLLLVTMMALAVAVVGCKDSDEGPTGGSGGMGGGGTDPEYHDDLRRADRHQ